MGPTELRGTRVCRSQLRMGSTGVVSGPVMAMVRVLVPMLCCDSTELVG